MSIAQTVPVTFPNARWGSALLITTTLALIAFCDGVDAGCGTATCPIDLGSVNHRLREHGSRGLSVQFTVESITQKQPRYGTDAVSFRQILRPDHDEIKTLNHNVNMIGTYAFDARWAFSLSLPLVQREHSHIAVTGHAHESEDDDHDQSEVGVPTSWDFTELSDPVLRVRFGRRSEDGGQLVFGIGASLPLGATDIRSSDGVLAEPSLQPSTGGASLLLEAALRGHAQLPLMPKARRSMLDVSTELRLNAEGERDYRSGHQLLLHAGVHHALTERFDALAQLATRWHGRDNAGSTGELTDATGGVFVFASPGLQVELAEGLSLYGYYQWPLYQKVNEVQLTADNNLFIGVGYRAP